ncbi:MAG TPA: pyridoxamine 5'-phosphate oxidase family protein [Candidatus Saccharimonadales bacterium]|nr:pyridoxamine 5'-phosphate oxidase family protein [Candidatus Saccharimonadales bacterium]
MKTAEEVIRESLPTIKVMQLATSANNQPWACNVHYYSDDDLNLYWLSTEAREHSQHIAQNPKAAAAVMVHLNTSEENYIIGLSCAGEAECVGEKVDDDIRNGYQAKHNTSDKFLSDVASGANPHKWYRLKPTKIVLFDTKNFPDDPRQEWIKA